MNAATWTEIDSDIRARITSGELKPGDRLPPEAAIAEQYGLTGRHSVRRALASLAADGLIQRRRGRAATTVAHPSRPVLRSNSRYAMEKARTLLPAELRAGAGEAEMTMGIALNRDRFRATYTQVRANRHLADILDVDDDEPLLRREYETRHHDNRRASYSVSHMPIKLISPNPDLLDESKEPWPGGTQHQLATVGIEIAEVVDDVDVRLSTPADADAWGIYTGAPIAIYLVRCVLVSTTGAPVEVSVAQYPSDRTTLRWVTRLPKRKSS